MARTRRRWTAAAIAALLVAVVIAALVTDAHIQARTRHERSALASAQRVLSASRTDLLTATNKRAAESRQIVSLQATVAAMIGQLAGTGKDLTAAKGTAYLQGLDIGTLQSCLGGVKGALQQISANNKTGATQSISSVSGACMTVDGGANGGLVFPFDFPDPFVLRVGTTYFAYATNSTEGNIQIIESNDLMHWNAVGNALPSLPGWATPGGTWAPSVLQVGTTFDLYYSALVAGPGGGEECISVATATQPQGPFVDRSTAPLVCQVARNGSIDPFPFVDTDGTAYLEWKSNGGSGQPAMLWSQRLTASGTALAGGAPSELLAADHGWDNGVIEAPDLYFSAGRYFLFYSGNNWNSSSYAVGVATCTGPLGPCTEATPQPILSSGQYVAGPGGESVFLDSSGTPWMAFASWIPGAVGYPNSRTLHLRKLNLSGTIPVVEAAS
jgi:Glycosyl hydrolases family 43